LNQRKTKKKKTTSLTKTAAGTSSRICNLTDGTNPVLISTPQNPPQDHVNQSPALEQENNQSDAAHHRAEFRKCLSHHLGLRHSGRESDQAGTLLVKGGDLNQSPTWSK
jgi:hypothetical protein